MFPHPMASLIATPYGGSGQPRAAVVVDPGLALVDLRASNLRTDFLLLVGIVPPSLRREVKTKEP